METPQNIPNANQNSVAKHLLDKRMVFLSGAVEEDNGQQIIEQLLYMNSIDPHSPIHFYINSPGGMVTVGNGILNVMNSIEAEVYTYCLGQAASMGAILLSNGCKGHRYTYSLSEIMIHQPSMGGFKARSWEVEIQAKQIAKAKNIAAAILAKNCNKSIEQVKKDFDKDYWMNAEEAIKYGIVDNIITSKRTY